MSENYYGSKDDAYEAIKVIEAWKLNFNFGSVLKYIKRAGAKKGESRADDLKKALYYLTRELNADK